MTSLKQQVREALAGVCDRVFYQYPASFGEFPARPGGKAATGNTPGRTAGNIWRRWSTRWTFFRASTGEMDQIARRVDAALRAIGLSREYAGELYEAGSRLHHRVLRYRGVTDGAGRVYQ